MENNDYETLRQKNIAERNNILAELFDDIRKQRNEIKESWGKRSDGNVDVENEPPKKRRRTITRDSESFSGKGIRLQFRRTYNIRSRKSKNSFNDSESDNEDDSREHKNNRAKLTVMFPWAKPIQRPIDLMNTPTWNEGEEENDCSSTETRRKRKYHRPRSIDPRSVPSVDEVTQDMLDNIAERSTQKIYCKANGTSCHQCRQKTMDTKTVCRATSCIGVRGQFCGPCLQGRYGESVVEALKDPNWACPPCRDLCNCSICRTRSGRRPTGILLGLAKKEGYSSVMDYLQANTDNSE
ncbi:hypothetical protein DMN91_006798 [Ooceraea biroi]|uniref:Cell division cycle-associated 7-like protein n=1 Tax=Ooceraea biroi TaxID=2015173 RepID=A0A026W5P0_OOCBI|nr:cell division cycle-associated protein 7 [Ooceraea biroi]EZA51392.1 Cell division cycle-associated 7-like protein [Ooceraea biroi]RLU20191.1 hypothetical protein DMN91_006798 [Ooceraea biroi]